MMHPMVNFNVHFNDQVLGLAQANFKIENFSLNPKSDSCPGPYVPGFYVDTVLEHSVNPMK